MPRLDLINRSSADRIRRHITIEGCDRSTSPDDQRHGDVAAFLIPELEEPLTSRPSRSGTVSIEVRENVLKLALDSVASKHGLRPVDNGSAATYRVADDICRSHDIIDVLVVDALPVCASLALEAVRQGTARSVISADHPERLGFAIESLTQDVVSIPAAVIELARRIPDLAPRLHRLLAVLVDGHVKLAAIANRLGCSVATIKRDLVVLYDLFGVASRHELAETARALGYSLHSTRGRRVLAGRGDRTPEAAGRPPLGLTH